MCRTISGATILSLAGAIACGPSAEPPAPVAEVAPAALPEIVAPLHMIRVADDDGGRAAAIDPESFARWVGFANATFAAAGIRFAFDPLASGEHDGTALNSATGTGPDWEAARRLAHEIAGAHPDRVVVFVRHGPDAQPTGQGYAGGGEDFLLMPPFEATAVCGHQNIGLLAHELGHYLGLGHTFAKEHDSVAAAEAALAGAGPGAFDGDGIAETPPDPFVHTDELQCGEGQTLQLGGTSFALPRDNVMSYYDAPAKTLTPEQARRARATLALRLARPSNAAAATAPREAERLEPLAVDGCRPLVQSMQPWWPERWSGGRQLLCAGGAGGSLALRFGVEEAGDYEMILFATRAPDYAIVSVSVDGEAAGSPFDGYAPIVVPSGPVALGRRTLAQGAHELRFEVAGRHPSSAGFLFGIDAIELRRAAPGG